MTGPEFWITAVFFGVIIGVAAGILAAIYYCAGKIMKHNVKTAAARKEFSDNCSTALDIKAHDMSYDYFPEDREEPELSHHEIEQRLNEKNRAYFQKITGSDKTE